MIKVKILQVRFLVYRLVRRIYMFHYQTTYEYLFIFVFKYTGDINIIFVKDYHRYIQMKLSVNFRI